MLRKPLSILMFAVASVFASCGANARDVSVWFNLEPPAARYEVRPEAQPGYIWIEGYWDVEDGRHVWRPGHYVQERRGYIYNQPRWERRENRWELNRGYWDRDHTYKHRRYHNEN